MRIIDLHCDTILAGWRMPDLDLADGQETDITIQKLEKGGCLAQFFALWLPWKRLDESPYTLLKSMYDCYAAFIEKNKARIRPAYKVADIEANEAAGLPSALLAVEDSAFLEGKIERVQESYDMGVRLITLLWNHENSVGFPNSADPEAHMMGLKPFGIETVEEMNRLGIIIDVSHLSEGGFWDVARHSKKPFVASHSCARALRDHPRNLTDEQLKAVGEAGGVVGVNFESAFLAEGTENTTYERIVAHLLHMKDKAGIDALAFGSDFDGIDCKGDFTDYLGFHGIVEAMEPHFTPAEIDKICHGNALRVMREVIG